MMRTLSEIPSKAISLASQVFQVEEEKIHDLLAKIQSITARILKIGLGCVLCAIHPNLFSIGFLIGVTWSGKTQEVIDKVSFIWVNFGALWENYKLECIAVGAFAALPLLYWTWPTVSFLYAANFGNKVFRLPEILKASDGSSRMIPAASSG